MAKVETLEVEVKAKGIEDMRKFFDEYGEKIKAFGVLTIQPGDTVVINFNEQVTKEAAERIDLLIKKVFGNDIKALILCEDATISGVIRKNNGAEISDAESS